MEPQVEENNLDQQEDAPMKSLGQRWRCCACLSGCGCCLASPLLIVLVLAILELLLYGRLEEVENHTIPNILQELAGEWAVEPSFFPIGRNGMENWQKTRLVLKEDGTCEFHNITLYLTNPYYLGRQRPELTGKTLIGTWRSSPQNVSYGGGVNATYAGIRVRVFATEEDLIERAEKAFVEPKDRPFVEREFERPLGLVTEWEHEVSAAFTLYKISGSKKDYRLCWRPADPDEGIVVKMKRISQ